jgi:thiamine biosynthesis lipoprotein
MGRDDTESARVLYHTYMKLSLHLPLTLICLFAPGLLVPRLAGAEWLERVENGIMGTRIAVELWADDNAKGQAAIEAVLDEMRQVDQSMSTYKPSSEVSMVNARAAQGPVKISPELFDLLTTALDYSRVTDGAFDITYASVGYLYDYRKHVHPTDAAIAAALPGVDYRKVVVDRERNSIRFLKHGVRIDLGGIAKGYAVDRCIDLLRGLGIQHAMVNAGGDTRLLGDRLGKPWIVGIRDPRNEGKVVAKLALQDEAMSTSGDYERYFEENGVRYHHILVPGTGRSPGLVRSVTILGATATQTDGLSKPVFIFGVERGMEFIRRVPGVEAVIVDKDGKVFYSAGLTPPQ